VQAISDQNLAYEEFTLCSLKALLALGVLSWLWLLLEIDYFLALEFFGLFLHSSPFWS
jgi:hypothetical protein